MKTGIELRSVLMTNAVCLPQFYTFHTCTMQCTIEEKGDGRDTPNPQAAMENPGAGSITLRLLSPYNETYLSSD